MEKALVFSRLPPALGVPGRLQDARWEEQRTVWYQGGEESVPWEVLEKPGYLYIGVAGDDGQQLRLSARSQCCLCIVPNGGSPGDHSQEGTKELWQQAAEAAAVAAQAAINAQYEAENAARDAAAPASEAAAGAETAAQSAANDANTAKDAATQARDSALKAQDAAQIAAGHAQAMAGNVDFTGYLRYQVVTEPPDAFEQGVLYIVTEA